MRESAGILKTLLTFGSDQVMTSSQIAKIWGAKDSKVRVYLGRYRELGYLERLNPHRNPAQYRLTPLAHKLLANWKARNCMTKTAKRRRRQFQIEPGRMVNSVFALGNI